MSTNHSNKVKFLLSLIAMTSLTAVTTAANAETLHKSASVENLLSQAKLSLDAPTQQVDKSSGTVSLEKLEPSATPGKITPKGNGSCGNPNKVCGEM